MKIKEKKICILISSIIFIVFNSFSQDSRLETYPNNNDTSFQITLKFDLATDISSNTEYSCLCKAIKRKKSRNTYNSLRDRKIRSIITNCDNKYMNRFIYFFNIGQVNFSSSSLDRISFFNDSTKLKFLIGKGDILDTLEITEIDNKIILIQHIYTKSKVNFISKKINSLRELKFGFKLIYYWYIPIESSPKLYSNIDIFINNKYLHTLKKEYFNTKNIYEPHSGSKNIDDQNTILTFICN